MRALRTRRATRARGPLALSGGLALVGFVVLQVVLNEPPVETGMAAGEQGITSFRGNTGLESVQPASAEAARAATTASVAVPDSSDEPSVGRETQVPSTALVDDSETDLWDGPYDSQVRTPEIGSAAAWFEHYATFETERLQAEVEVVLTLEGERQHQIGLLKALRARGPEVARDGFLAAARLPQPEPTQGQRRGASLASFAIGSLVKDAAESGVRVTLAELAWDRRSPMVSRLRGRMVAALVSHATPFEYDELHAQLWRETDPSVLQSALGAARAGSRDLMLALGDLDPTGDLVRWASSPTRNREPREGSTP